MEELKKAYNYVYNIIKRKVSYGLILGSGLGGVTDSFENKIEISYNEIPEFPVSTVPGHDGRLVFGEYNGKFAVLMKGRFHFYEGYEPSRVVYGVRLMKLLGVEKLIITNAAGGVNTEFNPGDLMIITDHIGLFAPSPLRGPNFSEFGPRFPDMSYAYNPELIRIAEACAKKLNIPVRKGVYVFTQVQIGVFMYTDINKSGLHAGQVTLDLSSIYVAYDSAVIFSIDIQLRNSIVFV
jgi:purine-nucleoside phosphorylase